MRQEIYSIFDAAAKAYLPPLYFINHFTAVRAFRDAANDQASEIYRHAPDYTLFHVGYFHDDTGVLEQISHVSYGVATQYKDPIFSTIPKKRSVGRTTIYNAQLA